MNDLNGITLIEKIMRCGKNSKLLSLMQQQ
jgi:hypothetical protein